MKIFNMLCLTLAVLTSGASLAQSYPAKPVKIIVPYAAGGTGDILARLIASELTKQTSQSFVVENRTGAGGMIGYGAGAKSVGFKVLGPPSHTQLRDPRAGVRARTCA